MQGSLRAALQCLNSFSSTDFRADLAAIEVPVLVIHGTEDATVPIQSSSRLIRNFVPEAELIEYDGAPHGLFATEKDRLSRDLIQFLKASPVLTLTAVENNPILKQNQAPEQTNCCGACFHNGFKHCPSSLLSH